MNFSAQLVTAENVLLVKEVQDICRILFNTIYSRNACGNQKPLIFNKSFNLAFCFKLFCYAKLDSILLIWGYRFEEEQCFNVCVINSNYIIMDY